MTYTINRQEIVGHVGQDPRIHVPDNNPERKFATFSVATTERWTDKNSGERKEDTEWHDIVVYSRPLVEYIEKHVRKGTKVHVVGQTKTNRYTNKEGQAVATKQVVVNRYRHEINIVEFDKDPNASNTSPDDPMAGQNLPDPFSENPFGNP